MVDFCSKIKIPIYLLCGTQSARIFEYASVERKQQHPRADDILNPRTVAKMLFLEMKKTAHNTQTKIYVIPLIYIMY